MPISPMPPRAKKTSSSLVGWPRAGDDCSLTLSSFARPPDRNLPEGQPAFCTAAIPHDERPVLGKVEKLTAELFPAGINGQRFPGWTAVLAARRPDGAETDSVVPS